MSLKCRKISCVFLQPAYARREILTFYASAIAISKRFLAFLFAVFFYKQQTFYPSLSQLSRAQVSVHVVHPTSVPPLEDAQLVSKADVLVSRASCEERPSSVLENLLALGDITAHNVEVWNSLG